MALTKSEKSDVIKEVSDLLADFKDCGAVVRFAESW